jgi:hypothetical protein
VVLVREKYDRGDSGGPQCAASRAIFSATIWCSNAGMSPVRSAATKMFRLRIANSAPMRGSKRKAGRSALFGSDTDAHPPKTTVGFPDYEELEEGDDLESLSE